MRKDDKIYAVIDTNVLVSSLFSGGNASNPYLVVSAVLRGLIIPLYNDEIIDEYRDVLSRKKFNFKPNLINVLLSAFTEYGINTARTASDEILPDNDDIVFYEVKMSVDDSYLVTGNTKHFPQKPFVVTPAEMVKILRSKGLLK